LLLTGCTRTINRTAERKIRDVLPEYIGPARVWRAHVDNNPERTIRGRLARVTIDGEEVRLKDTVDLASLHVQMEAVEVDTRRQLLKSVGSTTFRAVVGEAAVNDYLRRTDPPDDNTKFRVIRLADNRLRVYATYRVVGQNLDWSAEVEPRIASPTRLEFDPDRFSILGLRVPLPRSILVWLARRLSDGLDLSRLPFPVRITAFRVEPGRLTFEGTADVMPSLNPRLSAILSEYRRAAGRRPSLNPDSAVERHRDRMNPTESTTSRIEDLGE
jgi:hypothetical protein